MIEKNCVLYSGYNNDKVTIVNEQSNDAENRYKLSEVVLVSNGICNKWETGKKIGTISEN